MNWKKSLTHKKIKRPKTTYKSLDEGAELQWKLNKARLSKNKKKSKITKLKGIN